jgi:hypothetical protein
MIATLIERFEFLPAVPKLAHIEQSELVAAMRWLYELFGNQFRQDRLATHHLFSIAAIYGQQREWPD